mmetsp:Transcript_62609/g.116468  ORF Transcript_62609/g.116468 Transcript_62609/m.116468 type:complete len:221 (+) Transcript_62609:90-752(+)
MAVLSVTGVLALMAAALLGMHMAPGDPTAGTIEIISTSPGVEKYLSVFKDSFPGQDYERYRGHIYRVLSMTYHLLGEKKDTRALEAALVFHDIGLWTALDKPHLDYLPPSNELAQKILKEEGWPEEEKKLVEDIIMFHHKLTPFQGPHEDTLNAVIAADLADFSLGMVRGNITKDNFAKVRTDIPDTGFHLSLLDRTWILSGSVAGLPKGLYDVMHIFKF